ncbi:MAG TPA: NAD(P)/FAD-dependent oxidoreductase [Longimicrobiaceae bacterium]
MPISTGVSRSSGNPTRVLILGGGVGGLAAAIHLERLFGSTAEITLVSRDNFFLLTPLLFEACSGVLDFRHCAQPIRPCLRRTRFIEATVDAVDPERRTVRAVAAEGGVHELSYDHLVVALGATTNLQLIPGSEHARTFKTVADALLLRNHLIERFERADIETDPQRRREQLTVVIIGGGLVGTELLGELTAFAADILRYYPGIRREELSFHLFEAGERLLPEATPHIAGYAQRLLERRGAQLHLSTPVEAIEPGGVRAEGNFIAADTVVLAAGIVPSPASAAIEVERDRRRRIVTDPTMRSVSHPNVWAIGDCASIPDPEGQRYPPLAQHAVRQARAVARNVHAAAIGGTPTPFTYRSLGTMAAFGHTRAAADVRGLHLTGFPAWWLRRTYYLFQMPRWETRIRIALDWTVALFFRPDLTKVDLAPEYDQEVRNCPAGVLPSAAAAGPEHSPRTVATGPGMIKPRHDPSLRS